MENKKIKFEFSIEEINIIIGNLSEGQFKIVSPVINSIAAQAEPQGVTMRSSGEEQPSKELPPVDEIPETKTEEV